MPKQSLIAKLEETAMEVTLQVYIHTHKFMEFHTPRVNNTQLITSTRENALLSIFVKIAHGHPVQLEKHVKTNAGL
jgi:hypothetical protein